MAIYLNHVQESAGFSQFQHATISKCGFFSLLTHTHTHKHHTQAHTNMDMKRDDGLHSFSFAKFKYFLSDARLHSFPFATFNYFPGDDGLHSFCSQHSKTFQAKDGLHSLLFTNTRILPTAKKQSLRSTCGKGAISFVFLILV